MKRFHTCCKRSIGVTAPLGFVIALASSCQSNGAVRAASPAAESGGYAQSGRSGQTQLPKVWEGRAVELFDDAIDPASVGLSMDAVNPSFDPALRERVKHADIVARVRVNTVTVDTVGEARIYHLGIQVGTPTLAPARLQDQVVELTIRPTSPAYAIAGAFDARLRGMTFVGFVKQFENTVGENEFHWHLAADTREMAQAIADAVALSELSGP